MTRQELEELMRTLPGVHMRWGIMRDLDAVLSIERQTGGFWDECRFRSELRRRDERAIANVILRVAVCSSTNRIRGFAVYELTSEDGLDYMTVLNMAALDPLARYTLIGDLGDRSLQSARTLVWATPEY